MIRENKRKKRSYLLLILFILLFFLSSYTNPLLAQSSDNDWKFDKEFLPRLGYDFKEVLTSPKNWDRGDLLTLSAVLGTGALLCGFDRNIHDWVEDNRTSFSKDVSPYVSKCGNGLYLTGFMAALYISGEISKNSCLRKTALLSFGSFLASSALVLGLKFAVGRARPSSGESSHSFHLFSIRTSHTSFPSGDAASAWAVLTMIAEQSEKIWVDIFAYSLASLVAFYRVHDNKHWASDAFIGSSLGFFVARKISALNRKTNLGKLKVSFQFSGQRQAISFSLNF